MNQRIPGCNILLQRPPSLLLLVAAALVIVLSYPTPANAQVPPRFYWKSLVGSNAVPAIFQALNGNANPLDPAKTPSADVEFKATVLTAGYARLWSLFDRSALLAILVPMGSISGETTIAGLVANENASGFGDPLVEFGINVIGPPPIRNIPDLNRYEPGFSLDIIADVAFPIGEYDNTQTANLGQNRWYGRVGAPIVWQLGPWVPGRRTTLELFPSIWFYSDNNDFIGGTLQTDPMSQLEIHLTRDFTETLWGSFDTTWVAGGKATVDGDPQESLNNLGLGFTLGYPINDNLQLTAAYMATVNDGAPTDLRMDGFRFSVVYGWHPLIEAMKRLQGGS